MKISEALELYLMEHEVIGSSVNTIKVYRQYVGYFIDFLTDIDINDVQKQSIVDYQLDLLQRKVKGNKFFKPDKKLSRFTVKGYITHLRAFFKWLYKNKYISVDIFDNYSMVKVPKLVKPIMSEYDIITVLESFGDSEIQLRNKCIFLLLVDCGFRLQEVEKLNIRDVIFTSDMIIIKDSKGDKDRIVPMSLETKRNLYRYFKFYRPASEFETFFLSIYKEPMTESAITSMLCRLKKKLKLEKLNPHYMRHTYATRYIINGGSMFSLQLLMGHEDIETTRRYVHLANYYLSMDYDDISTVNRLVKEKKIKRKKKL